MNPKKTQTIDRRLWLKAGALGLGGAYSAISLPLGAQEVWPARPVKLIVSSSPGGGTDLYARMLAQALGDVFKQQFVVENRPGASGNIGADAVAKVNAGAYVVQIYTGLIYRGPELITEVAQALRATGR